MAALNSKLVGNEELELDRKVYNLLKALEEDPTSFAFYRQALADVLYNYPSDALRWSFVLNIICVCFFF